MQRPEMEKLKKTKYLKVLSIIISLISVIAASTTLTLFKSTNKDDLAIDKKMQAIFEDMENTLKTAEKVKTLDQYKVKIEHDLAEMKKYPSDAKMTAHISTLDSSISDLDKRLKSMEQVVMQNPTKALEVPMLRKDLEVYKEANQITNIALRHEMERVYDFNKWFLGLMFTMFVSILGLALTNFIKSRSPKGEES